MRAKGGQEDDEQTINIIAGVMRSAFFLIARPLRWAFQVSLIISDTIFNERTTAEVGKMLPREEIKPGFNAARLERRRHPRFLASLRIEYGRVNSSKSFPGRTTNISEGGLMFGLPEQIKAGEKLILKIFFGSGPALKAIEATGTVVWTRPDEQEKGHYQHGLKFEEISPESTQRLKVFLSRFGERY